MWLEKRCGSAIVHPEFKQQTINDVWQEEQSSLRPIPQAFDGYVAHSKRVSTTCLVTYERNRYSVPAAYANQAISLHVYADRLDMVADGGTIAEGVNLIWTVS